MYRRILDSPLSKQTEVLHVYVSSIDGEGKEVYWFRLTAGCK